MMIVRPILFLLTCVPLGVTPQMVPSNYDGNCTKYIHVDIYILFDIGDRTLVSNMTRGFQHVREILTNVNLANARLAFWTGDSCSYARTTVIQNTTSTITYTETCSAQIADSYRFDFARHDSVVNLGQKLTSIYASLSEIESRTISNDEYMRGREEKRRDGAVLAGTLWLNRLKTMKRNASDELAMLVLEYATHAEAGDLNGARDAAKNVTLTYLKSNRGGMPNELHFDYIGGFVEPDGSPKRADGIVKTICEHLRNCLYFFNGTVRQVASCDWNNDGTCIKNLTGLYVPKKFPMGGTQCPVPPRNESCPEQRCNATCDQHHEQTTWGPWSACSVTCGGKGVTFRSRQLKQPAPTKCLGYERAICDFSDSSCIVINPVTTPKPTMKTETSFIHVTPESEPSSIRWYHIAFIVFGAVAGVFCVSACCYTCYRYAFPAIAGSDMDSQNPYARRPWTVHKPEAQDFGVHATSYRSPMIKKKLSSQRAPSQKPAAKDSGKSRNSIFKNAHSKKKPKSKKPLSPSDSKLEPVTTPKSDLLAQNAGSPGSSHAVVKNTSSKSTKKTSSFD